MLRKLMSLSIVGMISLGLLVGCESTNEPIDNNEEDKIVESNYTNTLGSNDKEAMDYFTNEWEYKSLLENKYFHINGDTVYIHNIWEDDKLGCFYQDALGYGNEKAREMWYVDSNIGVANSISGFVDEELKEKYNADLKIIYEERIEYGTTLMLMEDGEVKKDILSVEGLESSTSKAIQEIVSY